jgi:hypothetical protein
LSSAPRFLFDNYLIMVVVYVALFFYVWHNSLPGIVYSS